MVAWAGRAVAVFLLPNQGQQPVPLILYPLGEQARQGSVPKGIVHWAMASPLVRPLPRAISTSVNSMRQVGYLHQVWNGAGYPWGFVHTACDNCI